MKWLFFFVLFISNPCFAVPVIPNFTQGSSTSRTETSTNITESIRTTEYNSGYLYSVTGSGVQQLIGSTTNTKCLFLKIRIPDRDTLSISNKAYIHKIRLTVNVSVAGSSIFCYPMSI